jgi:hypothetical protein
LNNMNTLSAEPVHNKNVWTLTTPPGTDNASSEREIKKFIDILEEDNLVKANTFSVAVAKGELYIDGQLQPESVKNKYSSYIQKTGDFITKESKQ